MIKEKEIRSFIKVGKSFGSVPSKFKLYKKDENSYTFRFGRNCFLKITYLKDIEKYRVFCSTVEKLERNKKSTEKRVPKQIVFTWNFKTGKPKFRRLRKDSFVDTNYTWKEKKLSGVHELGSLGLFLFKKLNNYELNYRVIEQTYPILKHFPENRNTSGIGKILKNFDKPEDLYKFYLIENKPSIINSLKNYYGNISLKNLPLIKKFSKLNLTEFEILTIINRLSNYTGLEMLFSTRVTNKNKDLLYNKYVSDFKTLLKIDIYSLWRVLFFYKKLKFTSKLNIELPILTIAKSMIVLLRDKTINYCNNIYKLEPDTKKLDNNVLNYCEALERSIDRIK